MEAGTADRFIAQPFYLATLARISFFNQRQYQYSGIMCCHNRRNRILDIHAMRLEKSICCFIPGQWTQLWYRINNE